MPQSHPIAVCLASIPMPVKPGHAVQWPRQMVVVRRSRVVVHVGLGGRYDYSGPSRWIDVHLWVDLTPRDAPRITVNTSPRASIDVSGAPGTGPLLVSEWWFCPGDARENGARERMLDPRAVTRLTLSCAHPVEWHGLVGRLNHSVVRFDLPTRG